MSSWAGGLPYELSCPSEDSLQDATVHPVTDTEAMTTEGRK